MWCRRAAEQGRTPAVYNLGRRHRELGEIDEAERWLQKAAQSDHGRAMALLGEVSQGRSDLVEAERWYRRAAEAGEIQSMHNLAVLLWDGGERKAAGGSRCMARTGE
jgi:uncharacterized protein